MNRLFTVLQQSWGAQMRWMKYKLINYFLCFVDRASMYNLVNKGLNSILHTRQSSTQNNKYQVSHKYSCFSWWWAHSRPKHVEINKYIKNKLCTRLALFIWLIIFCYFQFHIKDPAGWLGANSNTGASPEHPFFESKAVEEKNTDPPLEPQIKEVSSTGYLFIHFLS